MINTESHKTNSIAYIKTESISAVYELMFNWYNKFTNKNQVSNLPINKLMLNNDIESYIKICNSKNPQLIATKSLTFN